MDARRVWIRELFARARELSDHSMREIERAKRAKAAAKRLLRALAPEHPSDKPERDQQKAS